MVPPNACYFGGFSFWFPSCFPGHALLLNITECTSSGTVLLCTALYKWYIFLYVMISSGGGAGVWGVYRNYELVDVRLTYFKVCILSSCEHGEGCSQSWLKDVRKSTWTSVRCLELWIIWQKNKTKNLFLDKDMWAELWHSWMHSRLDRFMSGLGGKWPQNVLLNIYILLWKNSPPAFFSQVSAILGDDEIGKGIQDQSSQPWGSVGC